MTIVWLGGDGQADRQTERKREGESGQETREEYWQRGKVGKLELVGAKVTGTGLRCNAATAVVGRRHQGSQHFT